METPAVTHVEVNGHPCRVWSKGSGHRIGFLAGFGGLPKWIPFLETLAADYEIVVPSIPGFPGATGHAACDNHLDWVMAVRDLLREAGLLAGAPLIGSGPGGSPGADLAVGPVFRKRTHGRPVGAPSPRGGPVTLRNAGALVRPEGRTRGR
jgi:hypothetical protein